MPASDGELCSLEIPLFGGDGSIGVGVSLQLELHLTERLVTIY